MSLYKEILGYKETLRENKREDFTTKHVAIPNVPKGMDVDYDVFVFSTPFGNIDLCVFYDVGTNKWWASTNNKIDSFSNRFNNHYINPFSPTLPDGYVLVMAGKHEVFGEPSECSHMSDSSKLEFIKEHRQALMLWWVIKMSITQPICRVLKEINNV